MIIIAIIWLKSHELNLFYIINDFILIGTSEKKEKEKLILFSKKYE